nr:peroxiredoxin [Petropleomorpha daqingensis]
MPAMQPDDVAPDFELPDQFGIPRSLSDLLRNGPVAIFFYPLAGSGGCTKEMCGVRDRTADFTSLGAQPIGISRDSVERQRAFAEQEGFDFPLLSDADGAVCAAYGVSRSIAAAPVRRHTVVVGANGRVTEVVRSEFRFGRHAAKALAALDRPM